MDRYSKNPLPLYGNPAPKAPQFHGMGMRSQFQITGPQVVASCLFWVLMCFLAFKGFQYGAMYMSFDDSNLDSPECCKNYGGSIEDNRNFVDGYNKGDAGPYLMRLGPESYTSQFKGTPSPKELEHLPAIVTAVASADFFDVQGLIKQINEEIRPAFKNINFLIYDIGLYNRELEIIRTHCKCEVRTFRASSFPDHVADISNFAYRPILIQTMIEEFGSVLWLSPSTRLTRAGDLSQLKYRGERDFFVWQPQEFIGLVAYTNPKMFEYLKEHRCCYTESGLIDMSALVFYRTNDSWTNIMKPWLKCALNKDCIVPPKSRYEGCFHMRKPKTTGCHRYDQSALSIIMDRMYQFNFKTEKYVIPKIARVSEQYVEYFPEQPWTFTELFFVTLMPFTCLGGLYYIYKRRQTILKGARRKR